MRRPLDLRALAWQLTLDVLPPPSSKGKVFFICSLPLGPGHDSGGQKTGRLRNEVDLRYKCDFFCWASAVRLQAQDAKFAAGLD